MSRAPSLLAVAEDIGCTTLAGNADKGSTFHHLIADFRTYPRPNRGRKVTQGHWAPPDHVLGLSVCSDQPAFGMASGPALSIARKSLAGTARENNQP